MVFQALGALAGMQGLRVSPVGELLFLAWPRKSNQKEGHPGCVGLRLPCDARRPRRGWNSPWQGTQNMPCCGARTPSPLSPRAAALLGDTHGAPEPPSGVFSPSALPIGCAWTGKKRNRVRAPQHGAFCVPCQGELVERPAARAQSGTRRAAMWGRLSLVTFFGEAKKVTRPQAKNEAVADARHSQRTTA
jgi:hypothetical protein